MSDGGSIEGRVAQVKWAYVAAAIEGYVLTRERAKATWSLRASVVMVDRFKLSQKPLRFVALHAHGQWSWPIVDFEINAEQVLTARLGPLERF